MGEPALQELELQGEETELERAWNSLEGQGTGRMGWKMSDEVPGRRPGHGGRP